MYWEFMLDSHLANLSSENSEERTCDNFELAKVSASSGIYLLPAVESLCMEGVLLPRSEQPPTQ
jgi:hypothetical protein